MHTALVFAAGFTFGTVFGAVVGICGFVALETRQRRRWLAQQKAQWLDEVAERREARVGR